MSLSNALNLQPNLSLTKFFDDICDINSPFHNIINHTCSYLAEDKLSDVLSLRSNLSILHVNCRSLAKNFDLLKSLLNACGVALTAVCLTESWLNKSNSDDFYIPGYNFVSSPRVGKRGGWSWHLCQ